MCFRVIECASKEYFSLIAGIHAFYYIILLLYNICEEKYFIMLNFTRSSVFQTVSSFHPSRVMLWGIPLFIRVGLCSEGIPLLIRIVSCSEGNLHVQGRFVKQRVLISTIHERKINYNNRSNFAIFQTSNYNVFVS